MKKKPIVLEWFPFRHPNEEELLRTISNTFPRSKKSQELLDGIMFLRDNVLGPKLEREANALPTFVQKSFPIVVTADDFRKAGMQPPEEPRPTPFFFYSDLKFR